MGIAPTGVGQLVRAVGTRADVAALKLTLPGGSWVELAYSHSWYLTAAHKPQISHHNLPQCCCRVQLSCRCALLSCSCHPAIVQLPSIAVHYSPLPVPAENAVPSQPTCGRTNPRWTQRSPADVAKPAQSRLPLPQPTSWLSSTAPLELATSMIRQKWQELLQRRPCPLTFSGECGPRERVLRRTTMPPAHLSPRLVSFGLDLGRV